jgi:hypothetical protein
MIDENEILPLLISVQENGDNILLRFDEDILNQTKNEDCILIIDIYGCEEYQTKISQLKSAIGESIDYHPVELKGNQKKLSFLIMRTLEQIDIVCAQIKESKTKYDLNDLLFRCDVLSKSFLDYKKNYHKVYRERTNAFDKLLKHVENEINILQQKEIFFKNTDSEKYLIAKGKLEAYKDFLSIIKGRYITSGSS